jgi:hypothetical protein
VIPDDFCAWDEYSQPVKDSALWLASQFLWAATGRQYGPCPVTVRPAQGRRGAPMVYRDYPLIPGQRQSGSAGGPFMFNGRWFNAGCDVACCGSACAIVLAGPVDDVVEVVQDGEVIDSSAYRVDVASGEYLLVRLDGECWPACQNFRVAGDAEGGFEVTYLLGRQLPESLAIATALLACEYGKHLSGGACALPAKMTRVSRQGVEIEVSPPEPAKGLTGIKTVDDVIASLNPSGRHSPPMLLWPDAPGRCDRMTVVPAGGSS